MHVCAIAVLEGNYTQSEQNRRETISSAKPQALHYTNHMQKYDSGAVKVPSVIMRMKGRVMMTMTIKKCTSTDTNAVRKTHKLSVCTHVELLPKNLKSSDRIPTDHFWHLMQYTYDDWRGWVGCHVDSGVTLAKHCSLVQWCKLQWMKFIHA